MNISVHRMYMAFMSTTLTFMAFMFVCRCELQSRASDMVAERMASQQLLLAVALAAKQLEQQWSAANSSSSRTMSLKEE
jgi:hypothetical protein